MRIAIRGTTAVARTFRPARPSVALLALAGCAAAAHAQSFTLVGHAPGGPSASSYIRGLSDDGRAAAGESLSNLGWNGLWWTPDGGRVDFRSPTNFVNIGGGISGDGQTVVGDLDNGNAFRWTQSEGVVVLGTIPGYAGARGIDANYDGSVIVGTAGSGSATTAFRWTQAGGMQPLGLGTKAFAVSGDGNVIVGEYGTAPVGFTWTPSGGFNLLPGLGGPNEATLARGINSDGTIVVGRSGMFTAHATMWINNSPMELLSADPINTFTPQGVSNDGSVVAGVMQGRFGLLSAGVWTAATNTIPLADYLAANGVTVPTGITLSNCTGISADGLTFAGYTTGDSVGGIQGWVASLAPPCPADLDNDGNLSNGGTRDHAVDVSDLLYFLSAFEAGTPAADLDNGTGTRTHDGAVDVNDLLFFLTHFETGC